MTPLSIYPFGLGKQMFNANILKLAFLLVLNSFYCASASAHFLSFGVLPPTIENYSLEKISKHIYTVIGPNDFPNPKTRGFMNNPAAILTDEGFVIVDPGSGANIGREFLKKLKCISSKPVIAIFDTHVHGDHWLGNQGIRESYPDVPIYAHYRAIERLNAGEAKVWFDRFNRMTEGAISDTDTRIALPNKPLKGDETIKIGDLTFKFYHPEKAHSNTDMMIEVVEDKVMFTGDVVMNEYMPYSAVPEDASFKGTIKALQTALDNDNVKIYVPGHGLPIDKDALHLQIKFTQDLIASVKKYYLQGLQAHEMKDLVAKDMEEYRNWSHFDELGKVIAYVYSEVEEDNF